MREKTIQVRITLTAHKIAKKQNAYMSDWISEIIIKAKNSAKFK